VHSDGERSQHKNRSTAMRILRSKLFEVEQKKHEEKMGNIHAQKKKIEWGSQIRSYVLAPYRWCPIIEPRSRSATSTRSWTAISTPS
jgi:peptide chain release factor 2